MKKFLVGLMVFTILIVAVLIQINLLNVITLAGVAGKIGIVIIVGIGLMCDKTIASIIGGAYGFMIDVIYRKSYRILSIIIYGIRLFLWKNRKRFFKRE